MNKRIVAGLLCFAAIASSCLCQTTIGWRTDGTGCYPTADPLVEWSKKTNVIWSLSTPEGSNCTPAIWGNRIFITTEPAGLMCISKADGKIIWQVSNNYKDFLSAEDMEKVHQAKKLEGELDPLQSQLEALRRNLKGLKKNQNDGKGTNKSAELTAMIAELEPRVTKLSDQIESLQKHFKSGSHSNNGYATSTPVTDGRRVWTISGIGMVACYDMDGGRKWIRKIDRPASIDGQSASLLMVGGKLLVQINEMIALDAETGQELWRTQSRACFGTSVVATVGGEHLIITPQGDFIRISDGAKLASVSVNLDYNAPVVADGVVYFAATSDGDAMAVKLPEKAEKFEPVTIWKTKIFKDRYYASPACSGGLLYAVTQEGQLTVLDAAKGTVVYSKKVKGLRVPAIPALPWRANTCC